VKSTTRCEAVLHDLGVALSTLVVHVVDRVTALLDRATARRRPPAGPRFVEVMLGPEDYMLVDRKLDKIYPFEDPAPSGNRGRAQMVLDGHVFHEAVGVRAMVERRIAAGHYRALLPEVTL